MSGGPAFALKEKGKLFLDLFGGTGGVSKALAKFGFRSVIWDTQQGPEFDLSLPGVEKKLNSIGKSARHLFCHAVHFFLIGQKSHE